MCCARPSLGCVLADAILLSSCGFDGAMAGTDVCHAYAAVPSLCCPRDREYGSARRCLGLTYLDQVANILNRNLNKTREEAGPTSPMWTAQQVPSYADPTACPVLA